ncbi:hypothetical protein QBC36DRAFT_313571 [Triangularia setosa]|uniref:Uncharacterized protein n=1 Tax=Triangularia setosa TaxID=2587417 RepID=A0AAN6W3U3_9PEZI|nr:hypothetical protein QBC36DRAFT_313571 [Podospora setosa]
MPFLVTYKFPNIADLSAPESRNDTLYGQLLPGGGPVKEYVDFMVVSEPYFESGERSKRAAANETKILNPAPNAKLTTFHTWYRDVYLKDLLWLKGWRRTSRFDISNGPGGQSRWLALHEFDKRNIPVTNTSGLLGQTQSERVFEVDNIARQATRGLWGLYTNTR